MRNKKILSKRILQTRILMWGLIFLCFISFLGSLELNDYQAQQKGQSQEKLKEIRFGANKVTVKNIENFREFDLFGNVVINDGDITLKANHMKVSGESYSQIKGKGQVVLDHREMGVQITGFRLVYDREPGNLQMFGAIELKHMKEGFTARGDSLEIKVKEEGQPVILRGSVRFFKDKLFARSDFGIYNQKLNTLYLVGNNYVVLEDGKVFLSDRTTVNLSTNEVSMESDTRRDEVLRDMKIKIKE